MGVGKLLRGKILGRDGHGRNGNYFYREAGLHMLGVERADYVCQINQRYYSKVIAAR